LLQEARSVQSLLTQTVALRMMKSMAQNTGPAQASHRLSRPAPPACMRQIPRRNPQTSHTRLTRQVVTHAAISGDMQRCIRERRWQSLQICASASAGTASTSTQSMDDGAAQRSPLVNDIFGGLTTAIVALPLALAFGVASGDDWQRTAVLTTHFASLSFR
jgi:hypothetical protein